MIHRHIHEALSGYLKRNKIPEPDQLVDAAVVLSVDGRHRVYCRPAPFGDLIFECAVADIPDRPSDADELVKIALLASFVRLETNADYPVLSRDGYKILVHQRIPADASIDEFELSLENFLNSLAEWRRIFRVL